MDVRLVAMALPAVLLCAADSAGIDVDVLWKRTATGMLAQPVWANEVAAYSASHELMVPMAYAFTTRDSSKLAQFDDHFSRLLIDQSRLVQGVLVRTQYLYFASEYLRLCQRNGRWGKLQNDLASFLHEQLRLDWLVRPAVHYTQPPFPGLKARLRWKLDHRVVQPLHARALMDEDLFVMGIAGNLVSTAPASKMDVSLESDVQRYAVETYQKEVAWTAKGGWVLQPGIWDQHPDYAYSGSVDKKQDVGKGSLRQTAWDVSHTHRFPLLLCSMRDAYPKMSVEYRQFDGLLTGLRRQFVEVVLIPPDKNVPVYRVANFMDGREGLYRWRQGPDKRFKGYGAHQLSATLLLGWWSFLGGGDITRVYANICDHWPLPKSVLDDYFPPDIWGDAPDSARNPDSKAAQIFKLDVFLAYRLLNPQENL